MCNDLTDLACLDIPDNVTICPFDLNDISRLKVTIHAREGIWRDLSIDFECKVPEGYPYERLRMRCISAIRHPNILGSNAISCAGAVCLNIIREDWRPVYTLSTAVMGLLNLLLEPQTFEPLDEEAASLLESDPDKLREINLNLFE